MLLLIACARRVNSFVAKQHDNNNNMYTTAHNNLIISQMLLIIWKCVRSHIHENGVSYYNQPSQRFTNICDDTNMYSKSTRTTHNAAANMNHWL